MSVNHTVAGFSLTNRLLLYASVLLAPAQFVSGLGSYLPSNVGFLAYNLYTQWQWYRAVRASELHALSLVVIHFNIVYLISYLGSVSSGSIVLTVLLTLGSMAAILLNLIASWFSWKSNLPDGFGEYRFFLFGWRTLNHNWYKFFLVWQIFETIGTLNYLYSCCIVAIAAVHSSKKKEEGGRGMPWWATYAAIPLGAAIMLLCFAWPLVLWVELIVAKNHIESATDWVAVWLFIGQVGAMLLPSIGRMLKYCYLQCVPWSKI